MPAIRSLHWSDIPGFTDLPDLARADLEDPKDLIEPFIGLGGSNPHPVAAYVSRFKGILVVYYDGDGSIRFIQVLPDSEDNRRYVIYKLSELGPPPGMSPDFRRGTGN